MSNDRACHAKRFPCTHRRKDVQTVERESHSVVFRNISRVLCAVLFFCASLLFCSQNALSSDIQAISEKISKPITISSKGEYQVDVVFNHTSHKGLECFTCHHQKSEKGQYVSCSECHTSMGRSQDVKSTFQAFHSKTAQHSCMKCHLDILLANKAKYGKTFSNCRPCHKKLMKEIIREPITLHAQKSPLLDVVFNHTSHKGISCFTCHHKKADVGYYVACSECHPAKGKSKDPQSQFVAYHAKKSDHSCLSCHREKAAKKPDRYGRKFYNCRPCHMPRNAKN